MSPSGSHRRDRLKHPLPSASKCVRGGVCAGQAESGRLDVNTLGLWVFNECLFFSRTCHVCMWAKVSLESRVPWAGGQFHTRSRCMCEA
jgi:hypothetical protein